MRLNAPKKILFWISVVIAVIGLVFFFIPAVKDFAVFVALSAFILLALGNVLKGF